MVKQVYTHHAFGIFADAKKKTGRNCIYGYSFLIASYKNNIYRFVFEKLNSQKKGAIPHSMQSDLDSMYI